MLLKLLKLNSIYDLVHQDTILLKFKLKINSETYSSLKFPFPIEWNSPFTARGSAKDLILKIYLELKPFN